MTEVFKPESKSVLNLFGGAVSYQIPSYQRPYKWDTERVEQLWDDLLIAFEQNDDEYFLGSIILVKKGENTFEVVDGQQRMTTLTILFCVLRDIYYGKLSDKRKANEVIGRIKNLENEEKRLKFRTQSQHQNRFEQEIINGIDFSKQRSKNEIKSDAFLNAAYVFKDKITSSETKILDKIEDFVTYILNKVKVITIECSSPSFAIKIFQNLNSKGLDLTAADLIKSHLMMNLKNEEDISVFESDWIIIESKAKEFGEELTNLFTYYEYYLLSTNPKKSLYEELIKLFSNKNPQDIIYEFKKLIEYFSEIDNESSKIIYSLEYLKHDVYWKSILLSAKLKGWSNEDFIKLARLLRNYYYLYWIAEYTTTKIKQTSFNIISWIKEEKNFEFIKEKIDEKIKEDRTVPRALKNLKGDIYQFAWCKPLFAIIEYAQTDDSINEYIDLTKFVHIEHILPQGYEKISYWMNLFSKENAERLKNTLGNLTLLSGKKNISASNSPFPEKIEIYKGKGKDGVTAYRITQQIIDKPESFDWTADKILDRTDFLLEEISKILEVDFNVELEDEDEISESTEELYGLLEQGISNLGKDVETIHRKHYIAFKKGGNFASVHKQRNNIKIWLHLLHSEITDPKKLTRDVSNKGHHGTGNLEVTLSNKEDLPFVLDLVKKSLEIIESSETRSKKWDWNSFKERLASFGQNEVIAAESILKWCADNGVEIDWSSSKRGSFILVFRSNTKKDFCPFSITGEAKISWNAPHQGNKSPAPFDKLEKRAEILKQLTAVNEATIDLSNVDGYSAFKLPLSSIANEDSRNKFFSVLSWIKKSLEEQ